MSDSGLLRRQSLSDQVSEAILAMIVDRGLQPGERLPSTEELADHFTVSRTVIREALADLAGRGEIERSQGRHSTVAKPGTEHLEQLLRSRVRNDDIDVSTIMEFRQTLEVESARLASLRRTEEQLGEIEAAWEALAAARTEGPFQSADVEFHRRIAVASGNRLIVLVIDALAELLRDTRQRSFRGRKRRNIGLDDVVADHRAILTAIRKQDPRAAIAAMTHHLEATNKDLTAQD